MGTVNGFLPSQNAFHFINSWPNVPDFKIPTPMGEIKIGNAANGLCGGMVYAVRDLMEAGRLPPSSTQNPGPESPAFQYLVKRLFESFDFPEGVFKIYQWMNLPRRDKTYRGIVKQHGLSWLTINESLPAIRECIDGNSLCPIIIIRALSPDPRLLGENHQVLVYGYEDQDLMTILHIYDPNYLNRDDLCITFDHTHPEKTTDFVHTAEGANIFALFPADYHTHDPAPLFQ